MVRHLAEAVLYESPLVRVLDVTCHAPKSACGEEELTESARVVLPRRGVFRWHVNGGSVVADAGTALFLNRDDGYRVSHPTAGGDECTVLVFAPELLQAALAERGLGSGEDSDRPFGRIRTILQTGVVYRNRLFHSALRQAEGDPLATEEIAALILRTLAGGLAESAGPTQGDERALRRIQLGRVEDARALLACQPEADLSLADVSRRVSYSPFHLARLFRAATGTSLQQYRLRLRLATALDRLAEGVDDLSRLAADLGFASHSHFSASFRRLLGVTPSHARSALAASRLAELRTILTAPLDRPA